MHNQPPTMITRFITEVVTKFNPFSARSRATRLFLSSLPPDARQTGITINNTVLPRTSTAPPLLLIKFKDGKEMKLDGEQLGIKGIVEEVDRHSRALQKQADLTD
ncbi:putative ribosomal protein YmL44, mitochondrial [Jackrogersella minutella]|nr:putative ribosomal protein YmL44, mitochondrial [Jackrogersella minutella]